MTQETVRVLADKELTQIIAWAQDEQRARAEQRKHETIAKIKEMAGAAGISVSIHSKRGRPQKAKLDAARGRTASDDRYISLRRSGILSTITTEDHLRCKIGISYFKTYPFNMEINSGNP